MEPDDTLREVIDRNNQAAEQARLADEYRQVDRIALKNMPDKALAEWQGNYPPRSAQFILAEYEWQRRLTEQAVKAQKFAALMALAGVALGAVLTYGFGKLSGDSKPLDPEFHAADNKQSCDQTIQATDNSVEKNTVPKGNAGIPVSPVHLK